jgi:Tfp pilus assembly protein FimV
MNRYRLSSGLSRVRLALGLALLGALVHAAPVLAAGASPAPSSAPPSQAHAAPQAGAAPATSAHVSRVYVTVAGDTLDRVIRKTMADSPLKDDLLRQALIAANPKAFAAGRNSRLKPGTELKLPETHALLREILLPLLSPTEVGSYFPPPPSTAEERRRWVRYP